MVITQSFKPAALALCCELVGGSGKRTRAFIEENILKHAPRDKGRPIRVGRSLPV